MAIEEKQALVLEQPKDQKVYLDLQHSTDWVVVISVIASALISFIGFLITIYIVKKSTESQIVSNKNLVKQQERLKIRELKILNRNNILDKIKELVSDNLYLAGNIQNQIEIGINEIRQQKFNDFFHSRHHGDFKIVLNNYQSSINRLKVYLGNENRHAQELNKHFRRMQLLSWSLYTANMHEPALSESLDQWIKEFKVSEILVQNYLNDELKLIYED
ncbi:hypothetical protein KTI62_00795 [Acinetobacter schindleri]|uniref:DUF4760 domain-containing protein n=1 Tax=Acinetobacter schindleri NIPH 900 TaxID=1217675 RepID=N8WMF3_9GAMM|nr:hypothetical protein [Acinetobacter schindleri]ENV13141.1 hypothetical protein F965_01812 [Acinetobacter schindleri NIPH 900]MCU4322112.1 hypothetical protein [Acinetobacter schindleri]MCU4518734.1 hypothetical protein [Acinetobacter schindleri]